MSKDITKPSKQDRFIFTPQHEEIIRDAIYPYHMLTSKQITSLIRPGKPGNLKKIQERLTELNRNKYLTADQLATKTGQRPNVYTLGIKGRHYVEETGWGVEVYYQPSEIEHLSYKKLHTLELNNFLILAATLPVFEPRLSYSDMQHELIFERHPLEYLGAGTGELKKIKPDALFKLHFTRPGKPPRRVNCWVELDRGHVNDERMQNKMSAIYDYINRGYMETHYGKSPVLVFFVTTAGVKRAEHLKKLFRQVFPGIDPTKGNNQMFRFAEVPPLMQPQPSPLIVFTQPYWTTAYGDPNKLLMTIGL